MSDQHDAAKPSGLNAGASPVLIPAVIFLFVFAVFLPTLAAGFIDLDDTDFIVNNHHWKGLSGQHLRWMFTDIFGHYMPLTWLSYAINYAVGGMSPAGYHLTNVLIHCLNAVLVYFVALRLIRAAMVRPGAIVLTPPELRLGAGIGALVWGAHPLRVESVAWITERRDVLSTLFLLGALLAYLRMAERAPAGGPRARGWMRPYLMSIGLLVFSLLSKSWGMSFFVIVALLDWYPLGRLPGDPRRWFTRRVLPVLLEKAPYAALGLGCMVLAGFAQRSAGLAMRSLDEWPVSARIAQAAYGLVFYVWKSVVPTGLAPLYELPVSVDPLAPGFLVCYALVLISIVTCFLLRRRFSAVVVTAAAFAIIVAPVLGFLQSGVTFVADRYSYVSCIGWSLLFGVAIAHLIHRARRSESVNPGLIMAGAAAVLLTFGVLTLNQAAVWRNSLTLWEHAVQVGVTTSSVRVNYGLNLERLALMANARQELSDEEQHSLSMRAVEQFRMAVESNPADGRGWFVLGNTLKRLGQYPEAERALAEAAKYLPQKYTALVNRGRLLIERLNRREEGMACLHAAVADIERPRTGSETRVQLSGVPYLALGSALWNAGDHDEAKALLRKGLKFEDSHDGAAQQLRAIGENP